MKAKYFKTIDAMEAPKWSRLRSDPHFDVLTNLADAPPIPAWLRSGKTIVPTHDPMQHTLETGPMPEPVVDSKQPVPPPPPPKPQSIMAFDSNEDAWFTEDHEEWFVKEADILPTTRDGLPGWLAACIGFTVVAVTWSSIGWLILRTL